MPGSILNWLSGKSNDIDRRRFLVTSVAGALSAAHGCQVGPTGKVRGFQQVRLRDASEHGMLSRKD
jgi:hypothetical protein